MIIDTNIESFIIWELQSIKFEFVSILGVMKQFLGIHCFCWIRTVGSPEHNDNHPLIQNLHFLFSMGIFLYFIASFNY